MNDQPTQVLPTHKEAYHQLKAIMEMMEKENLLQASYRAPIIAVMKRLRNAHIKHIANTELGE